MIEVNGKKRLKNNFTTAAFLLSSTSSPERWLPALGRTLSPAKYQKQFALYESYAKRKGKLCNALLVFAEFTSIHPRRKLLRARRTEGEFEAAKDAYFKTRQKLLEILSTWDSRGQEQVDKSSKQLQSAHVFISRKADGFIQPALEKVLRQWGLVDRESDSDSTNSLQRTPPGAEFSNQVSIYLLFFSIRRPQ